MDGSRGGPCSLCNAPMAVRTNSVTKVAFLACSNYVRTGCGECRSLGAAMLVQLPEFKKHKIDERILEVILMHGRTRLMLNADKTKIRAIQGHTLDTLD